ncbi:hypothetical protein Emag_001913 [Eimeria magna]
MAFPDTHVERSDAPKDLPDKMHGFSEGIPPFSLRRRLNLKFGVKTSLLMLTVVALTFLVMRCMRTMLVQPHAVSLRLLSYGQSGPSKCDEGSRDEDVADSEAGGEVGDVSQNTKQSHIFLSPIHWSNLPYQENLKVERVLYDSGGLGKRAKATLSFLRVIDGARFAALVARTFAQEAIVVAPLLRPQFIPLLQEPIKRCELLVEKALLRLAYYPGLPSQVQDFAVTLQHTLRLLKALRDNTHPAGISERERMTRLTRGLRVWHAMNFWVRQAMDALLRKNPGGLPPNEFAYLILDRLTSMVQAREVQLLRCPITGHRLAQFNLLIESGLDCAHASLPPQGKIIQPLPLNEIHEINAVWKNVLPDVSKPPGKAAAHFDLGAVLATAASQPAPSTELQGPSPQLSALDYELPAGTPGPVHMPQPPHWSPNGQYPLQVAPLEGAPDAAVYLPPSSAPGAYEQGSYAPEFQQGAAFVVQPGDEVSFDSTDQWIIDGRYDYHTGGQGAATGYESYADHGFTRHHDETISSPYQTQDSAPGGSFQEEYGDDWIPEDAADQDVASAYEPHFDNWTGHYEPAPWAEAEEESAPRADPTPPAMAATPPTVYADQHPEYFLPSGLFESSDAAEAEDSADGPYSPLESTSVSSALTRNSALSEHLGAHSGLEGTYGSTPAPLPHVPPETSQSSMLYMPASHFPPSLADHGQSDSPSPASHSVTHPLEPYFHLPSDLLGLLDAPLTGDTPHGPHSPRGHTSASSSLSRRLWPFMRWASRAELQSLPATSLPPKTFGSSNYNVLHSPFPPPPLSVGAEGASTFVPPSPAAAPSAGVQLLPLSFFLPSELLDALGASPTEEGGDKPPSA